MTDPKMVEVENFIRTYRELQTQAAAVENVDDFGRLVMAVFEAHEAGYLLEDEGHRRSLRDFLNGIQAVIWGMVEAHQAGEEVEEPSWRMFAEIIVHAMVKD